MANRINIWNRDFNRIKKCLVCGDEFKVKLSALNRRKCCSRKCKNILQSKIMKGNKNNYKKEIGRCLTCGKEIKYSPSTNKKYCNQKCYIRKAERNTRWKGGVSDTYCRRIKPRYKCEVCKSKKDLQIHHINKNHKDNRIENLIVLCKDCHWNVHRNKLKLEVNY